MYICLQQYNKICAPMTLRGREEKTKNPNAPDTPDVKETAAKAAAASSGGCKKTVKRGKKRLKIQ
jgi:hypothetical protein